MQYYLRPAGLKLAPGRTAPRHITRAVVGSTEAIFIFETAEGRGSGVLRLTPDPDSGDTLKAWTLLTALDEIKGHEERLGGARPVGKAYSRIFVDRIGSISGKPPPSIVTVIPPSSSSVEARQASQSLHV